MARYKVTMGWDYAGQAPTETYISADSSASTAVTRIQKLIDKRNQLIANVVNWRGVRFSIYGSTRRSVFYPPGSRRPFDFPNPVIIPSTGSYTPTANKDDYPDQIKSSLQLRFTYDVDRTSTRYLSLAPDNVLVGTPTGYAPGKDAKWAGWLDEFIGVLINDNWSIRAQKGVAVNPKVEIRGWIQAQAAPSNMGFVVDAAPPIGVVKGGKVKIESVRRKGTDALSYNGTYIVDELNTTLGPTYLAVYLRGTADGDVESIKLLGTARKIEYDVFPILKVEPIKATTHKRGNSFGRQRGRQKKRLSLDP